MKADTISPEKSKVNIADIYWRIHSQEQTEEIDENDEDLDSVEY